MPTKVMIADDHQVLIDSISIALEQRADIKIVKTVNDGRELINVLENGDIDADVLVLDVEMPQMKGDDAIPFVKKYAPNLKILMLTMKNSPNIVTTVKELGVHGYVLKKSGIKTLLLAIESVAAGHHFFDGDIPEATSKAVGNNHLKLTRREKQILELAAQGKTIKEMSETLFIGVNTVQRHRSNIMEKFGVHNIYSAVIMGRDFGFIE
ncbi:MAG: response regulator [Flammeovirgaceae bacterium]